MQYDGQISSDGKFHGHGKIVYANGESYDGEWHAGQRHGTGTYRYSDGGVYVGSWESDRINGRGVSQARAPRTLHTLRVLQDGGARDHKEHARRTLSKAPPRCGPSPDAHERARATRVAP